MRALFRRDVTLLEEDRISLPSSVAPNTPPTSSLRYSLYSRWSISLKRTKLNKGGKDEKGEEGCLYAERSLVFVVRIQ